MEWVEASPRWSVRKQTTTIDMSGHTILIEDLSFHPYEIMITQQLLPQYYASTHFARRMLPLLAENVVILTSDEAHFHLSGFVN